MATVLSPLYDEVLDFLLSAPTPEQVAAFHASGTTQARVDYLLERNRSGVMSPEEKAELDEFMRVEHFVRMLKIRALQKLTPSS
jgi:hypothetical protein